jgi:hypothetical protein
MRKLNMPFFCELRKLSNTFDDKWFLPERIMDTKDAEIP